MDECINKKSSDGVFALGVGVGVGVGVFTLIGVLRLCTYKSPTSSAFIGDKGNCFHALEKCEGVIDSGSKTGFTGETEFPGVGIQSLGRGGHLPFGIRSPYLQSRNFLGFLTGPPRTRGSSVLGSIYFTITVEMIPS